ncbi:MAG TPA: hypothetical protein PKD83_08590 [Ignavibacteria bacterium]|nr:hypothetical protein [Ignavibacteria bacterium]
MIPQNDLPHLTPDEKLKMENDLLKAKLIAEFGMKGSDSILDSEMENQWLNHIYDFEKTYADAGRISIYEFIGKPEFQYIEDLNKEEISSELERLHEIMSENGILLDTLCEYEDELIYKFITEEFFKEETDNVKIEGMNHCFTYEDYHPNHEYDLKNQTEDFICSVFKKEWNKEFYGIYLFDTVEYEGTKLERDNFMETIITFQKANNPLSLLSMEIQKTDFDFEKEIAEVNGMLAVKSGSEEYSGKFRLKFKLDFGYWVIDAVMLPESGNI